MLNVNLPSAATGNVTTNYTVSIPAGATKLVVATSGGTGDADLYVRLGAAPTTTASRQPTVSHTRGTTDAVANISFWISFCALSFAVSP
mgnify:CR=1 FL=1